MLAVVVPALETNPEFVREADGAATWATSMHSSVLEFASGVQQLGTATLSALAPDSSFGVLPPPNVYGQRSETILFV